MEILKFKFSDEDFSSVPTNNFLRYKENPSNLLAFQQEIFFKEENNHLPQEILDFATHNYIENVFESNSPNTLRPKISQKAKFSKKLPNKTLNPLIPKKKNLSNKFINPIKNQKSIKTDLNKRKKWNEDNKTNRLFQNLGTIKLNEEKIQKTNEEFSKKKVKLRENKESTERLKHKTYETTELLEESLMKKGFFIFF